MAAKEKTKLADTENKQNKSAEQKPKSKTRLYWEEYLMGVKGEILDMRAVLK